ncbi:MAG: serine/threonine protein kinase [Acidaminococcaceae bacterium]|nr:serine/threonine protein kinase [Acidaminococcaceae bacterium]
MVGEILNGRYEILKSVGFGGMAEVYLARDVLLDRKIAVKVLRKKFLNSKAQLEQFKREARSAARLIHPSIVTIYDVCDAGDISYILMEYVEGVSLKAFEEQNGRMDPALAVALTAQLASALDHAHKHNIIHCDIKPQNIVLTESMVPKIVDFGISRIVSNETMAFTASVVGSVHYFSPEQAQGLPVTAQSDIYSLGIVFYEMLTGKVPFDGNNAVSVARMQVEETAPPLKTYWPDAPDALQRIIDKALEKNQQDRYASAEDMRNDLMEVKNRIYPSKNNETFLDATIPLQAIAAKGAVKTAVSEAAVAAAQKTEPVDDGFQTLIMRLPSFLTKEVDEDTNEYEPYDEPGSTQKVEAVAPVQDTPEPEAKEAETVAAITAGSAIGAAALATAAGAAAADNNEPEQQSLFADERESVDVNNIEVEVSPVKAGPEVKVISPDVQAEVIPEGKPDVQPVVYPVKETEKGQSPVIPAAAVQSDNGNKTAVSGQEQETQNVTDQQSNSGKEDKPKKKSGILGTILKILLLLILLAAGAVYYFFGSSKPEIAVPDVNGKTAAEAQQILKEKGFKVELEDKIDSSAKPGMVLRMDPVAGIKRKEGATVTLTVASAEKTVAVPRIAGLKLEQAEKLLAERGLRIEKIEQKWDSTKPEDVILSQSPEENSKLSENGGVTLIINKKEEKNIAVPDLKGLTLAEARKKLEGLQLKAEVKEIDSDRDKDTVLGTDPDNGATVMEGGTVTLQVSNAKKKMTFPSTPDNISTGSGKSNGSVSVSPSTGSRYVEFVVPGTGTHTVQIVSNNGSAQKVEVSGAYSGGVRLRTKVGIDVQRVGFYVDHRLIEEKSW